MCTYNQLFHTLICYISKSFAVDIFFYICSRYVKGEILLMLVLNSNQSINHTVRALSSCRLGQIVTDAKIARNINVLQCPRYIKYPDISK
jgi:hypothetical protein